MCCIFNVLCVERVTLLANPAQLNTFVVMKDANESTQVNTIPLSVDTMTDLVQSLQRCRFFNRFLPFVAVLGKLLPVPS